MMRHSEKADAFGSLLERSVILAGADPLDRIAVRDFTLEVEIGAFQSERGVRQHVRFNVVVEVSRHSAAMDDDVDKVLSYDTIVDAIEAQLAAERINLLETLAERIAERILANPKAVRVFVRIEKLDRIPGSLGVEIVRTRIMGDNVLRPVEPAPPPQEEALHPLVVFLPNDTLYGAELEAWLDALLAVETPLLLCVDHAPETAPQGGNPAVQRRIDLLSIEQNAWVLAGKDSRCVVVDSRTELEWAIRHGQVSVWAPSRMVLSAIDKPDSTRPQDLAAWFARVFDATALIQAGPSAEAPPVGAALVTSSAELAEI